MSGKLKINEIARQTGLSISTVSRVLAGKPNTSASVREKVMTCARSDGILANLPQSRMLFNHVTVFAPKRAFDLRTDIYYYRVIQGIRSAVAHSDVHLSYCSIEENNADALLFLKKFGAPVCDAAIIIGVDDPHIHALAASIGKPCVLINSEDDNMGIDSVSPDHARIGRFSAKYLIENGHRDFLTLMCLRRSTMEHRLNGIREAFSAHNIVFEDSRHLLVTTGFTTEEAHEVVIAHMSRLDREQYPSAILAGGDFIASGAMTALLAMGLNIPSDISVMSMDGFNLVETHDIPLTVVHVPRDELGVEALRLLQQRITTPETPFCHLLLGGKLVVGDSVRRIDRRTAKGIGKQKHSLYGNHAV